MRCGEGGGGVGRQKPKGAAGRAPQISIRQEDRVASPPATYATNWPPVLHQQAEARGLGWLARCSGAQAGKHDTVRNPLHAFLPMLACPTPHASHGKHIDSHQAGAPGGWGAFGDCTAVHGAGISRHSRAVASRCAAGPGGAGYALPAARAGCSCPSAITHYKQAQLPRRGPPQGPPLLGLQANFGGAARGQR